MENEINRVVETEECKKKNKKTKIQNCVETNKNQSIRML